jgi:hypothetical protein
MIVVGDEGIDLGFEVAGQIVVFQQYPVLEGLVPAFDLTLCLGMACTVTRNTHWAPPSGRLRSHSPAPPQNSLTPQRP